MSQRVLQPWFYATIFALLIALTGLTIGVSLLPLGEWHLVVGLAIATAKALLVVLFFMHLYQSDRLFWIVAVSGVVFVAILLILTMNDYFMRSYAGNL